MTILQRLVFVFSLSYFLLSLPQMLGFGFVIDWVPEASLTQKFKVYVLEGLTNWWPIKLSISCTMGFLSYIILVLKRQE